MLKDGNAEDRARRSEDGGRPPAQRGPTPRWEISRLATASPSIGGHGDFVRWRRGQKTEDRGQKTGIRDPLAQIHFFLLRTSWRKLGELASVFSRSSLALSVSLAACFARSRRTKNGWNPRYPDAKRIDH